MKTKKLLMTTISISSILLLTACGGAASSEGAEENGITLELFSNKSENIVRQILGRGMRLKKGKTHVSLIDFIELLASSLVAVFPVPIAHIGS